MPLAPARLPSIAAAALCVLCALVTAAWPQVAETPDPAGEISVEQSGTDGLRQDRAIAQRIRDILSELDGYENVGVEVRAGVVTLTGRVAEPERIRRLDELVSRVDGVVTIENRVAETTDLGERLNPALERFQRRMSQLVAALPVIAVAILAGVAVFAAGLFLARLRRPWRKVAPNEFIADIYRQLIRVAFFVAGVVVALDILGATALLGTILGAAGIAGLAVGIAVRDTVENFIASVMLSVRQPFQPNDLVEIEGDIGKVIRLTSRATILLSLDGNHIRIPNATVFKARIVNFTRNDERRFLFDISVDAEGDLARAREIAQETVQALPFVLAEPKAMTWLETMNETGAVLRVTGWVLQNASDFALARGEALRVVKAALQAAGVGLPDPTYRIKIDGGAAALPPRKGAPAPEKAAHAEAPVSPDIDAKSDEALDRFVAAERATTDDLLTRGGAEE